MDKKTVNSKSTLLLQFLFSFYKIEKNMTIFYQIVSQNSVLSLRLLDWLITNYSKKYNIMYPIINKGEKNYFNIYLSYKNQLKAYSKKYFDPFCRRDRIIINKETLNCEEYDDQEYNKQENIVTTVGQLNFFKWFIENKVLDYSINNIKSIDDDMNMTLHAKKKYKRRELSESAVKGVFTSPARVAIKFN